MWVAVGSVPGMRIVHTSDWHLGRSLHGVDLLDHQAAFCDHLVELVRAERVDAVLVAGDVYDRAVPPVGAVELLSRTLARLAETATVVVTPGNHDSAIRLGFGAELMNPRVRLRARVTDLAEPVAVLGDDGVTALVYGLPFLDPDVVRHTLADGDEPLPRSHQAAVAAAMDRVRADLARRVAEAAAAGRPEPRAVVMAHAFVTGGEPSESERDIRVGGVDQVAAGTFAGVDYVALGHLHGPQAVRTGVGAGEPGSAAGGAGGTGDAEAGPGPVLRYCGSPLAYSFSERHQTKSTVVVDLDAGGVTDVRLVPAPVPRPLVELVGPLDALLGAVGEPHREAWLRAVVTDPARPPDLYRRVQAAFPHALVVQHRPDRAGALTHAVPEVTGATDPVEVATQFVAHVTGAGPNEAELAVLRRAVADVAAAERSA